MVHYTQLIPVKFNTLRSGDRFYYPSLTHNLEGWYTVGSRPDTQVGARTICNKLDSLCQSLGFFEDAVVYAVDYTAKVKIGF